jgi:hypothetical protein
MKQRNLKKPKKKNKPLHSQKRLGGLKPPLKQVQGDSKLHNLSGWETLASTRLTQGGTKSGRREGTPSSRQPKLRKSLPLSDEDLREREREREREKRYVINCFPPSCAFLLVTSFDTCPLFSLF